MLEKAEHRCQDVQSKQKSKKKKDPSLLTLDVEDSRDRVLAASIFGTAGFSFFGSVSDECAWLDVYVRNRCV